MNIILHSPSPIPVRLAIVDDETLFREGLISLFAASPDFRLIASGPDSESMLATLPAADRPDVLAARALLGRAGGAPAVGLHLGAAFGVPTIGIYCDHEPGLAGVTGPGRVASFGGVGQVPAADQVLAQLERHLKT